MSVEVASGVSVYVDEEAGLGHEVYGMRPEIMDRSRTETGVRAMPAVARAVGSISGVTTDMEQRHRLWVRYDGWKTDRLVLPEEPTA